MGGCRRSNRRRCRMLQFHDWDELNQRGRDKRWFELEQLDIWGGRVERYFIGRHLQREYHRDHDRRDYHGSAV